MTIPIVISAHCSIPEKDYDWPSRAINMSRKNNPDLDLFAILSITDTSDYKKFAKDFDLTIIRKNPGHAQGAKQASDLGFGASFSLHPRVILNMTHHDYLVPNTKKFIDYFIKNELDYFANSYWGRYHWENQPRYSTMAFICSEKLAHAWISSRPVGPTWNFDNFMLEMWIREVIKYFNLKVSVIPEVFSRENLVRDINTNYANGLWGRDHDEDGNFIKV